MTLYRPSSPSASRAVCVVDSAFTWQKELNLGVAADTTYLQAGAQPYQRRLQLQNRTSSFRPFSRPLMLVVSFNYTTPGARLGGQLRRQTKPPRPSCATGSIGGVLRYQSGQVIRTPPSNNALLRPTAAQPEPGYLRRGHHLLEPRGGSKPVSFVLTRTASASTPPRSLCSTPLPGRTLPPASLGTSAPDDNNYRWQRQPSESLSFGRNFRIREKMTDLGSRGVSERAQSPVPGESHVSIGQLVPVCDWRRRPQPCVADRPGARHANAVVGLRLRQHLQRWRGPAEDWPDRGQVLVLAMN